MHKLSHSSIATQETRYEICEKEASIFYSSTIGQLFNIQTFFILFCIRQTAMHLFKIKLLFCKHRIPFSQLI